MAGDRHSSMIVRAYFLEGGEPRASIDRGSGPKRYRPTRPDSLIVHASVSIYLLDTVPKTLASCHQVIDEAFSAIGIPEVQQVYDELTSCGRFEFFTREPYPKSATAVKALITQVFALIPDEPNAE